MDEHSTIYRVGDATVTRVLEQSLPLKTDVLFADFDPAVIRHGSWANTSTQWRNTSF
jgi:hypothetical protein